MLKIGNPLLAGVPKQLSAYIYLISMDFKYQLIFLGKLQNSAYEAIKKCFFEKIRIMGMIEDSIQVIHSNDFSEYYQNKQPAFVYYFGDMNHKNKDSELLKKIMDNGDAILPIYFTEDGFYAEIPKIIQCMNGKLYVTANNETYVNYALESLRLLRANRRLFISYHQSESSGVANQLFDVLVRHNYDVFLDTYSICAAKDFQEELHHRLTDSDVLIQLYTPKFKTSDWCNEEILVANQKQVGIIELVWPGVKLDMHNHLCEPIFLHDTDFSSLPNNKKCQLSTMMVNKIARKVESVRARNLAARQDNLIGEFVNAAKIVGRNLIQEYKYLKEHKSDGSTQIFIPAVGVPQSYDCFTSLEFCNMLKNEKVSNINLIYDDLRIKRKWIEHLDWLNEQLDVKTIKKQDFSKWLSKK